MSWIFHSDRIVSHLKDRQDRSKRRYFHRYGTLFSPVGEIASASILAGSRCCVNELGTRRCEQSREISFVGAQAATVAVRFLSAARNTRPLMRQKDTRQLIIAAIQPEAAPIKPQNGPPTKINAYAPSTEFPHTAVPGGKVAT